MTTYSRLSFTNEEEKNLIAFIEKHPSMWDPNNADYNNVRMRSQNWQVISEQLHKSDVDCRRKWRFIRDYYLNKRKRLQSDNKKHDSKYANLDFLKKVTVRRLQPRKKENQEAMPLETEAISDCEQKVANDNIDDNNIVESNETNVKIETESNDDLCEEANMEEHLEDISDSDLDFSDLNENEMPNTVVTTQLEMQCEPLEVSPLDELHPAVVTVEPQELQTPMTISSPTQMPIVEMPSSTPPPPLTLAESTTHTTVTVEAMSTQNLVTQDKVVDLFFESMAATVKTFPPHFVATAKMRVFQVISELEMQLHQVDN